MFVVIRAHYSRCSTLPLLPRRLLCYRSRHLCQPQLGSVNRATYQAQRKFVQKSAIGREPNPRRIRVLTFCAISFSTLNTILSKNALQKALRWTIFSRAAFRSISFAVEHSGSLQLLRYIEDGCGRLHLYLSTEGTVPTGNLGIGIERIDSLDPIRCLSN